MSRITKSGTAKEGHDKQDHKEQHGEIGMKHYDAGTFWRQSREPDEA
jgi:hypothetical protein